MSKYSGKRKRNIYEPGTDTTFKISRSKIELFIDCARCFFIDRRLGTDRPPGFPFNLNNAVDSFLKVEFYKYRLISKPHPLMVENSIDAIPYYDPKINQWRENFQGIQYLDVNTNLIISGAVDDVWINSEKELIVVDYKATSNSETINKLNDTWHNSYRRQMDIYQWLFIKNKFSVSPLTYFVYCNAKKRKIEFNNRLDFEINLIPYEANPTWVDAKIIEIKECLENNILPEPSNYCDYCKYLNSVYSEVTDFDFFG